MPRRQSQAHLCGCGIVGGNVASVNLSAARHLYRLRRRRRWRSRPQLAVSTDHARVDLQRYADRPTDRAYLQTSAFGRSMRASAAGSRKRAGFASLSSIVSTTISSSLRSALARQRPDAPTRCWAHHGRPARRQEAVSSRRGAIPPVRTPDAPASGPIRPGACGRWSVMTNRAARPVSLSRAVCCGRPLV
jgi:hypothetical protein